MQSAIDARLDVVEGAGPYEPSVPCFMFSFRVELVQSEDMFTAIKDGLKQVNKLDFDKLISCVRWPH